MTRRLIIGSGLLLLVAFFWIAGCDKEKIVNSKEYIHDTKYVEVPPDTIIVIDTVFNNDSVLVHRVDTVRIIDVDTVIRVTTVHDTIRITTTVHDTIRTVQNHYDTIVVHDTIVRNQCSPNAITAIAAMESQTNPMVLEFISSELGLSDGWIFYQTPEQMEVTQVSTTVYDIYSYVDYWAPDWSGYYPLEIYWRMTYISGDPAIPANWQMSDPPAAAAGNPGGIKSISRTTSVRSLH
jgi:hypothetical protein